MTSLLNEDLKRVLAEPARNCAQPADTPAADIRTEADGRYYPRDQFLERTKGNCAACPVKDACLQYALDNREEHGVWGGTTPKERRALLRKRAA